jgi:L-amino acid N-acyltransferase
MSHLRTRIEQDDRMVDSSPTTLIRDATRDDVPAILALYNALIATTTIAWTEHEQTLDDRQQWFDRQSIVGNPVLVADVSGIVVGFATYGDFRDSVKWPGYRFSVEHTIHVRADHWGSGVGRRLIEELIVRARQNGKHVMIGGIDAENDASIKFHERLGFVEVARMPETGRKFDRWLTLVLMQLTL